MTPTTLALIVGIYDETTWSETHSGTAVSCIPICWKEMGGSVKHNRKFNDSSDFLQTSVLENRNCS